MRERIGGKFACSTSHFVHVRRPVNKVRGDPTWAKMTGLALIRGSTSF